MYREWLKNGLRQPGKSNVGLARALGIDGSGVSRLLKGDRKLKLEEVPKAAAYLGIDPPGHHVNVFNEPSSATNRHNLRKVVSLTKIAAGGVLREVGVPLIFEAVAIPLVPEPRLNGLEQYATRIDGTDFNKILSPGDYALFVPYKDMRKAPQNGDIVEVERRRGNFVETTVRRLKIIDGQIEFWPESDDPTWQRPFRMADAERGEKIEITGFYVGLFRPNPVFLTNAI